VSTKPGSEIIFNGIIHMEEDEKPITNMGSKERRKLNR
jgi:hypothetical protein